MTAVHVVVPHGIHDPARPTGGNAYDGRICRGLAARGWKVHEHAVPGSWPWPDPAEARAVAAELAGIADGAVVLIDGLIASTLPAVVLPEANRLRVVVLVHMPLGDDRERAVLSAATAVVTTSAWTRERLLEGYGLRPDVVHVAAPGVDAASLAPGTSAGGELLCVAAVMPHKGHDVLLAALASIAEQRWRCVCVGPLDRDPVFVDRLRRRIDADGITDRVSFTGPLTGDALDRAYAGADALVLASHAETYGMVVTEALARGLPVVATEVGGLPEALGHAADGRRPGLLVPPDDPQALTTALTGWLGDAELRQRLRHAARQRRTTLSGWPATTDRIARVLTEAAA
jgi:glycosyltransferase involved in cell wall biosynthesis